MKTPVDVPWIVRVRQRSKLTNKIGAKNWYAWPGLTTAQRSDILNGRKVKGETMIAKSETVWAGYLPKRKLPDTGNKNFKVGQVWAVGVEHDRPYIFRVIAARPGGYFDIKVLAGDSDADFICERSLAADRSVLLAEAGEQPGPAKFEFEPAFSIPAGWCNITAGPTKLKETAPKPKATAIEIIARIMEKGNEHWKAGRNGHFKQVLVPKEDYETLVEYFHVGTAPFDEVLVPTAIGIVSVYPVNPDGATFVD